MRFKIDIAHQRARANTGAVNDEIEIAVDVFEIFETHATRDHSAAGDEAGGEVRKINSCIHQRDVHHEAAFEGCGAQRRGYSRGAEGNRPVRDRDFAGA